MKPTSRSPLAAMGVFLAVLVITSLACSLPAGLFGQATATVSVPPRGATASVPPWGATASVPAQVTQTGAAKSSACLLPNVVGLDQKNAETALGALGLSVLKQVEVNDQYPAGAVIRQDPPAGTRLDPCQGQASLWVSAGGATAQAVPVKSPAVTAAATATRAAAAATRTAAPTAGPKLSNPAAFDSLYITSFAGVSQGFADVLWDVQTGMGGKVAGEGGFLTITGQVEAMGALATYKQKGTPTRIHLARGSFAIPMEEFTLIFERPRDGSRYLALVCSGQPYGSAGTVLTCDLYANTGGKEVLQPNTHAEMCVQQCDIELELSNGMVYVYADGEQKIVYKNLVSDEGTIGLRVINNSGVPFTLDSIAVYEVPARGQAYGRTIFREEFGGDWSVDRLDDEYGSVRYTLGDWAYRWDVTAKKNMLSRKTASNILLPSDFNLRVDAQRVSGGQDVAYGAIFRVEEDAYYYVSVRDNGTVAAYLRSAGKWTEMIKPLKLAGIQVGAENRIRVEGRGSQYSVYVNDKLAGRFTDATLPRGGFGLALEINTAGQSATVDFKGAVVERPQP